TRRARPRVPDRRPRRGRRRGQRRPAAASGAEQVSAEVDPPRRRGAETRGHLPAELGRLVADLIRMLRQLLALGGEAALLLGAQVDSLGRGGRRGHAARGGAALRVLAPRPGEGRQTRVDLVQPPLGGAEIALEGTPPERGVGREGARVRGGGRPARRLVRRVVRRAVQTRGRFFLGRCDRRVARGAVKKRAGSPPRMPSTAATRARSERSAAAVVPSPASRARFSSRTRSWTRPSARAAFRSSSMAATNSERNGESVPVSAPAGATGAGVLPAASSARASVS